MKNCQPPRVFAHQEWAPGASKRPILGDGVHAYAALRAALVSLLLVMAVGSGCATQPTRGDPFEPVNRRIFEFNDVVDRSVLKPVAETYVKVVPSPVRTGIRNFFGNIDDFFSGINNALQWKGAQARDDFGRVLLNSGLGLLGVFDFATEVGIEKHDEDFGQTLGAWGFGPGPYLVLPLLGSSSVRDGLGTAARAYVNPTSWIEDGSVQAGLYGLNIVEARSQLLGTDAVAAGAALDRYRFFRNAYLQRRQYQVYDGRPPREKDDDDDPRETTPQKK